MILLRHHILFEIAPKLDPHWSREAYFDGGMFEVGTFVENVNTGVIGKIVSRGSNYVIMLMSLIIFSVPG